MQDATFIQVLLPLKLEWEPFYLLPDGKTAAVGDRVRVEFGAKNYVGVVSAVDVAPPKELIERILYIQAFERSLPAVAPEELLFWRRMADYYLCTVGEVYKAAYAQREQVKPDPVGTPRKKKDFSASGESREVVLSPQQAVAARAIHAAFEAHKTVLLHGVTGAGKTEIYLRLARECIARGKGVLFLVPEIALSRQLEKRVATAFPQLLVYHSATTAAKKNYIAEQLRKGEPYLVLGTRSALFLPHRNLGLVIVDEEHDSSFKQDSPAPRYHARESAIMLALVYGARVVLGSATPSLESLFNARHGRFVEVPLMERFHPGKEAELVIIDTLAERRKNGMVGHLSRKLLALMDRTLREGGQTVLLRSRRSYAPALQCTECGTIPKCPHCNVSLSLHLRPERLVCHYCGYTRPYTGHCPSCGGALQPLGAGTQKIEEEVQAAFPQARIARLDSDVGAGGESAIIRAFEAGETDILIGTQVVTKGFDFAHLSLVAVIQADNILGQQDFRADEHAIQLLEQFRGRSGRRGKPGLFVIQTREASHPVFSRLGEDLDNTAQMLEERRLFGYPPYTRLIYITLRDTLEDRLEEKARELAAFLTVPAVGPYTPTVDRIARQYIRQIRIMLPRDKSLQENKKRLLESLYAFEKEKKYHGHLSWDVDPV